MRIASFHPFTNIRDCDVQGFRIPIICSFYFQRDRQTLRSHIGRRVKQQITEALGPQPLALPEGVALDVTERGTYQITVGGVPLRSVNHAQRVALSVEMLAKARAAAGADDLVPIIVDNAESVQNTFEQWPNIIRFSVLQ